MSLRDVLWGALVLLGVYVLDTELAWDRSHCRFTELTMLSRYKGVGCVRF